MSTFERNVKGLLGTKLGMTQTWDENNRVVPVTVVAARHQRGHPGPHPRDRRLQRDPARRTARSTAARSPSPLRATSPRPVSPRVATSSRSAPRTPRSYTVGQELGPELFAAGDEVDVTGTSKGKGYAGVMKRHGFHGVGASHGAHRNHRKPGSIGACATPGRVFKGMRMAGRMGTDTVTTQNVTVHAVDVERGLILLKGAVPGPKGGLVVIRSAAKRRGGCPPDGRRRLSSVDLPAEIFDVQTNIPLIHQVVVAQQAAARQGTHVDQDPRRGPRRWPQALQAEGHRPRPSGLDPRAAVRRRWHRPRPAAAQLRPAHPQEDEGRRPARRPLRPGPRRSRPRRRGAGRGPTPSTKAAVKALTDLSGTPSPADRARARGRADLAVAAQRRAVPPPRRRPAQHLRRAAVRRRGLHQGRVRRVRAGSAAAARPRREPPAATRRQPSSRRRRRAAVELPRARRPAEERQRPRATRSRATPTPASTSPRPWYDDRASLVQAAEDARPLASRTPRRRRR